MSHRVLLVDDDPKLHELLASYLAQNGFVVTGAADGRAGLAALELAEFDAVLLDVMMPGLDGIEVCKRIRARSRVPIVMLTAKGDETDRVVGLELGADDYVTKPFSPRELLARLRALLRRAQPEAGEERLVVNDVAVDVAGRVATRAGKAVDLTGLELDLLIALMRRAGRVVARDALLAAAGRDDVTVIERAGVALGSIEMCPAPHRLRGAGGAIAAILAACAALWAASGLIARRLSRPIVELARAARDFGDGKLDARIGLERCRRPHPHDEVAMLTQAFNDMAGRIERQVLAERELVASGAHEVRTPRARIRLLTELTRDGRPMASSLDEIDAEVAEIDALVGALLANAKLDFGAVTREPIDAVDAARRALERAGLPAQRLRAPARLEVMADPTLVARALANLIENARDHGGGLDELVVEQDADSVRLMAEDSGPGLPIGQEARVFEPFHRGPGAAEKGSLGLGLSLVRKIASAHGGTAFASTRSSGGARVGFSIARPPSELA